MSVVLPRDGDLRAAAEVLNERLDAAYGLQEGDAATREDPALAFGDLLHIGEAAAMAEGFAMVLLRDVVADQIDAVDALVVAFRQGCALGAMAERRRWQEPRS